MNRQGSYHAAANEAATGGEQTLDANVSASNEVPTTSSERADERQRSKPLPEDALIILPVRNLVLFPGVILPITIGRAKSRVAAQEAARQQRPIGVLLQSKPEIDEPRPEDLHWVGTTANVLRYVTGADGAHHLQFGGTIHSADVRAVRLGDLHADGTDATTCPIDQNFLTSFQRPVGTQPLHRKLPGLRQRRRLLERHA